MQVPKIHKTKGYQSFTNRNVTELDGGLRTSITFGNGSRTSPLKLKPTPSHNLVSGSRKTKKKQVCFTENGINNMIRVR